jgi:hypothetical protein
VPLGLGEVQLLLDAVERVLAVPDPVGPGQQLHASASADDLVLSETRDHVSAVDTVDAKNGSHLGDHRPLLLEGDLVLVAGWRSRHESELYC